MFSTLLNTKLDRQQGGGADVMVSFKRIAGRSDSGTPGVGTSIREVRLLGRTSSSVELYPGDSITWEGRAYMVSSVDRGRHVHLLPADIESR